MDDATRLIISAVLLLSALSFALIIGFITTAMVGEINRKLPEDSQISYFGYHFLKAFRIREEYRRLYPRGRMIMISDALAWCMGILVVLLALVFLNFIG